MADETAALTASMPTAAADPVTPTAAERRSQASYARRQARYEEAVRLKAMGMPLKRIAATIGVERKTVRRWLRAGGIPCGVSRGASAFLGATPRISTAAGTKGAATPRSSGASSLRSASPADLERCVIGRGSGASLSHHETANPRPG